MSFPKVAMVAETGWTKKKGDYKGDVCLAEWNVLSAYIQFRIRGIIESDLESFL